MIAGAAQALVQLVHRGGDMRAGLVGITLHHGHRLVTADPLHGRKVHTGLHEVRDRGVA